MKEYMMALDQGTTSSRCILFDKMGNIRAKAQKEFAKIALDGLTGEEKRICKEVFHKICENADKYMR